MSPRAAWRLERLNFADVYDYVAGKADWLAAGLPTEGPGSTTPRPGSLARRDVPTCGPDETVAAARSLVASGQGDRCIVVNDARVVLGVLGHEELAGDDGVTVEAVMGVGPTTVRAHEDLAGLLHRMHERRVGSILVTDPDGRLLGVFMRDDGDRALPGHTWDSV
jgi:predicted transcriptional regulator